MLNLPDVEGDHKNTSGSESGVEKSSSQLDDGGTETGNTERPGGAASWGVGAGV